MPSIAIVGLALSSAAFAQQAQSQEMTTTTNDQETAKLAACKSWIRWSRRSLFIRIHFWLKRSLLRLIHSKSSSFSSGWSRTKNLKGKALADAVAKQPWDPSVQGLVEFPDVVTADGGQYSVDDGLGKRIPGAAI